MASLLLCLILCSGSISTAVSKQDKDNDEGAAVKWLDGTYNPVIAKMWRTEEEAAWDHSTNMGDEAAATKSAAETNKLNEFVANAAAEAKKFLKGVKHFSDPSVERQLKMLVDEGITNDPEYTALVTNTTALNNDVQICAWESGKQNCSKKWGMNEIQQIYTARSDYDKIKYVYDQQWIEGNKMKPFYEEIIKLGNKKATENGYKDYGLYKVRSAYEDPDLPATLERMWTELLPLYEQIHTYVRRALRKEFPGKMDDKPTIPSHLPNIWVQAWSEDPKLVYPYPKEAELNVTKLLLDNGYTAEKMYRKADDFVDSLELKRMEESFWNKSLFVQPEGRKFENCMAQMWEFGDGKDLRAKSCTTVTLKDWQTVNGILAHAEFHTYVVAQPNNLNRRFSRYPLWMVFEFAFELSSKTGNRLQKIGIYDGKDAEGLKAYEMNELMRTAMETVGWVLEYVTDFWRWNAFNGSSKVDNWDEDYHKLMLKYQGMALAGPKPKNALVAGADYDIASDNYKLQYLITRLIQFQFYEGLCNISGHKGPLHKCDFYGSKAAGDAIKKAFELGGSKPPTEVIKIITGQSQMSAEPLMRYYKPLYDWLKVENDKAKDCYGWGYDWPADVLKNLEKNRCKKK